MELFNNVFANKPLRLLDHTNVDAIFTKPYEAKVSFAIEDALATVVGQRLAPATVRLWVHDRTLVLGIPDSRLPNLQAGVEFMHGLHYNVIVRNSGGLAVLLDANVLNISFILPNKDELSIHEGYDLMYFFTKQLFAAENAAISAYEIVGSYCPGDYDLSIEGKKFAGISQRRVRNGIAVQMYVDIAGSSYERASIVKEFYDLAKGESDTSFTYPDVNPNVMASINDLLKTNFTVEQISNRVRELFENIVDRPITTSLTGHEKPLFDERFQQMEKRNEIIKPFKSEK